MRHLFFAMRVPVTIGLSKCGRLGFFVRDGDEVCIVFVNPLFDGAAFGMGYSGSVIEVQDVICFLRLTRGIQ